MAGSWTNFGDVVQKVRWFFENEPGKLSKAERQRLYAKAVGVELTPHKSPHRIAGMTMPRGGARLGSRLRMRDLEKQKRR